MTGQNIVYHFKQLKDYFTCKEQSEFNKFSRVI
jgi:hypothetical protein